MAEFTLASASEKQVWSTDYLMEQIRESSLQPYMSESSAAIIRIRNELVSQGGAYLNTPLLARLKGRGVRGSETLRGNEEDIGNYNDRVFVDWIRNGVVAPESSTYKTEIDILAATKPILRNWSAELLRDELIDAFGSVIIPGLPDAQGIAGNDSAVNFDASSAAQRNAYLVRNSDRVLFGGAKSNAVSGVWATASATVSAATGKLSYAAIQLAKRIAKTAGQQTNSINIRPYKSDMTMGREWFVLFCNSLAFRDIGQDPTIIQFNASARAREGDGVKNNPFFNDGDLLCNGVVIREIPEFPVIVGAGAAGIDIGQNFLCGQSALTLAFGRLPEMKLDPKWDYDFRPGVAIQELRGQKKTSYNGLQYGVVTMINSAVADG